MRKEREGRVRKGWWIEKGRKGREEKDVKG